MKIAPDKLTPHPKNSRKHSPAQIEQLKASLQEFGFMRPIVVDEDKTILAGHGIHAAALELGLKQIDVVVRKDLTDEQKRAYLIADNRLSEMSRWDHDLVAAELDELRDFEFEAIDLNDLFPSGDSKPVNREIGADRFLLQIECDDEGQLESLFEELLERGLQCKILS